MNIGSSYYNYYNSVYKQNMALFSTYKASANASSAPIQPGEESALKPPSLSSSLFDSSAMKYITGIKNGAAEVKTAIDGLAVGASAQKKTADSDPTLNPTVAKLEDLAAGYNKIYGAAINNSSDLKAQKLFGELVGVSKTYASALSKVGIGFDDDGFMKLDSDKLTASVKDGSLERFLSADSGKNYGFKNSMNRLAGKVSSNTAAYVSKSSVKESLAAAAGNSVLSALLPSGSQNSGWLFDFLI